MGGQRILLTGGAGFIGSHLAEALIRRGAALTIVDNLDDFYDPSLKCRNLEEIRKTGPFEFEDSDICDADAMRRVMKTVRPDYVVHLAARAGVRPSIEKPRLYETVNVAGTVNLVDLSREFSVVRFIFGSSSSVYGATSRAPFSEEQMEGRPISPYAATKLAGELICYTYSHLYCLQTVSLRFFTVYGPRQRPDLAIHKFTAQIEAGKPILVFGDGTAGRDYTHVQDIVSGVTSAIDYRFDKSAGAPYEVFNLGNSHPVTLAALLEALERTIGKQAIREQKPMQPGDVPLTWADISKAGRLLGYHPKVSLEEGLQEFVSWFRSTRIRAEK